MKVIIIILIFLLNTVGYAQELIIVEQNFDKAQKIAKKENKLLFIDFYTTWCAPCKKLDKWIFQNDTISQRLSKNFVLLKYNAEKDKEFNLSKKHHVNSYPTGIVLNNNGFVVNRKYGFLGKNVKELSESIFEFANQSIALNQKNKFIKGYSNTINIAKYPDFYIDFVNRENIKVTIRKDFKNYWKTEKDRFSEEYFSTLVYFADKIPIPIMDDFLKNKKNYIEKYGKLDVEIALFHMIRGRFNNAIEQKNKNKFDKAIIFMKKIMNEDDVNRFLPIFKNKFKKATAG